MVSYNNLTIIGTSHIAVASVREVKKKILGAKPDIVALELDRARFVALLSKKRHKPSLRMLKELGLGGFLFNVIGAWVEKKLGKLVGVSPGAEMVSAIKAASQCRANVALIDRDIRVTIRHLCKYITWKERLLFLFDIFAGLFFRKGAVKFDLRKVPPEKIIKKMIKLVKKRYPSFYKALIKERDVYMAKNLYSLMNKDKDKQIVAVVGAGHEESIAKLIKSYFKKGLKWNIQNVKSRTLR